MGLTSSLTIGRSALNVADVGLQVSGNNMANALTPGFRRQTVHLAPTSGQRLNARSFVGRGVNLTSIRREIDDVLLSRVRWASADQQKAVSRLDLIAQLETIEGELSEFDLSSSLSSFFGTWSELSNAPTDDSIRALTVQEGVSLADQVRRLRNDFTQLRDQIDAQLESAAQQANTLLEEIGALNAAVVEAEGGQGVASALRDQRDLLIDELSTYMSVTAIENEAGAMDIYVGSLPVVIGETSRGVSIDRDQDANGEIEIKVQIIADGSDLDVGGGIIGGLISTRFGELDQSLSDLDELAATMIFEVNKLVSQGQSPRGFKSVAGTYRLAETDIPLNDSDTGLPFEIVNGSFVISVTENTSGQRVSHRIDVDLDGIGTDMSLEDLVAEINSVAGADGITASITNDGRLNLAAGEGRTLSFSDDTAGVLAGLGVNTYFTGRDATDIGINDVLLKSSAYLAVGTDYIEGSNGTALLVSELGDVSQSSLEGESIHNFWRNHVESIAISSEATRVKATATAAVRENLSAQLSAATEVSMDEEAINLVNYQQQYEAAARFVSTINDMMQVLMNLV